MFAVLVALVAARSSHGHHDHDREGLDQFFNRDPESRDRSDADSYADDARNGKRSGYIKKMTDILDSSHRKKRMKKLFDKLMKERGLAKVDQTTLAKIRKSCMTDSLKCKKVGMARKRVRE